VRGDNHGQDERRNNAEAIQDLPLGHGCEQGVAFFLQTKDFITNSRYTKQA
jgi:hypothetical protein